MKKILALFLALSCFSVPTFADDENITVKLYGEEIHDKGVIINGRTLLPVRFPVWLLLSTRWRKLRLFLIIRRRLLTRFSA